MEVEDTNPQEIEEELRKAYSRVNINFNREPLYELKVIRDKLWDAYKNDRIGNDPVFAKFMYDELVPKLCPRIEREYGSNEEAVSNLAINQLFYSGLRPLLMSPMR